MIKNGYLIYGGIICAVFAYATWTGWDVFAIAPAQRGGPAVMGQQHK